MTWEAVIKDQTGKRGIDGGSICPECAHGSFVLDKGPCHIPRLARVLGNLITSIDKGSDGHTASGMVELLCSGFEPKPED
jgi:hypothetical protein